VFFVQLDQGQQRIISCQQVKPSQQVPAGNGQQLIGPRAVKQTTGHGPPGVNSAASRPVVIKGTAPVIPLPLQLDKLFRYRLRQRHQRLQGKLAPANRDEIIKAQAPFAQDQGPILTMQGRTALPAAGATAIAGGFPLGVFSGRHDSKLPHDSQNRYD